LHVVFLLGSSCRHPGAQTPDASPDASAPPFDFTLDFEDLHDDLLSVWIGDLDDVLVVGGQRARGRVREWHGATWRVPYLPDGTGLLWWTWGQPGSEAFAVGEDGTVLRRRLAIWRREPTGDLLEKGHTLFGVWGSSERDVFVVGGHVQRVGPQARAGVILHFDGDLWSRAEEAETRSQLLYKVWGASASDVWAVGEHGAILHYDGKTWSPVASGTSFDLFAVHGRGPSEVYAVGGGQGTGVILRWDGQRWSPFAEAEARLSGVWTAPGRALYVCGDRGFVARYGRDGALPSTEERQVTFPTQQVDFHAVTGGVLRILVVGADLLSPERGHGAMARHGQPISGEVIVDPPPDAGPADAAEPDAIPIDASPDAALRDGPLPKEGEACDPHAPICAEGVACWELKQSGKVLCTKNCEDKGECGSAYGPSPCCALPGYQTTQKVCIPGDFKECQPPG
jgi:photosystem II stability/assembly factor-like uncharacterized protein